MTTLFLGDTGTAIILDCGINISSSSAMSIHAKKPDLSVVVWPAELQGTNSIKHTLLVGDLTMPGTWYIQAAIEMPNWKGRGTWAELKVLA